MNKKTKSQITFTVSVLVILFSSILAIGQTKPSEIITSTSVGEVKLGMTVGEAKKVLPKGYKLAPAAGDEGIWLVGVYEGEKLLFTIGDYGDFQGSEDKMPPINESQKIQVMLIMDSRFKTVDVVHIGMPIAEAEKKYGKLKEVNRDPHSGETGKFTNQPENIEFSFRTKSDVEITVAVYEKIPNCKITDSSDCLELSYAKDSYISEMMISKYLSDESNPDNMITQTSVGNIKLGMTIGEARKALPSGYTLGPGGGSEGLTFIGVFDGEKQILELGEYGERDEDGNLPPIDENQVIQSIGILDSRYKTAENVGIGTSVEEAEKHYGKLKEIFFDQHVGEIAYFSDSKGFGFLLVGKDGKYGEAGNYVGAEPQQYGQRTKKYNPGAYISAMSISSPQPVQKVVSITDSPNDYSASIYGPMKCVDDEVSLTTYVVSWKVPMEKGGYSMPAQNFEFEGLMPCPELGFGTDDNSVSYKDQWDVVLDDFNFDGMTDLALRDGNNGGYGSASYQVYLFSKADNKFVQNPSFTELGQYQGMFEVKASRKMIYNHTKSGCCSHRTEGYTIVNNKPFKVYDHTVEGMIELENGVTTPEVITKKLIDGKWRTWDKSSAAGISFDKGKTSKTISVKLTKNDPIKWFKVGASEGQILNATINSINADVRLVDFKGNVSSYDSYEPVKEGEIFPVKLKGIGEYYLELSAEQDLTVELTISIK